MTPYFGEYTPIVDNGLIIAYVFEVREEDEPEKHEEDNHESNQESEKE